MTDKKLWHRRDRKFEPFDHIELIVTPRYKTSGLSGDEWRTGVVVKFWFKCEEVHETFFTSMDAALMMIGAEYTQHSSPIPDRVLVLEKTKCAQPGCPDDSVARFELKSLTSDRGEILHESEWSHTRYYRQFCRRHLRRGDASLEDADRNYIPLDGIGPDGSTNVVESPSVLGGVIEVGSIEEIPGAIKQMGKLS